VLTSVNNAAWIAYFGLARDWTALIPSASVTLLAALLALTLSRRGLATPGPAALVAAWAAAVAAAYGVGGTDGLGTVLVAGFMLQVTPSVRAVFRTTRPTGVSAGTWLLILGELGCWLAYGLRESDPRLIILGVAGVAASAIVLSRAHRAAPVRLRRPRSHAVRLADQPGREAVQDHL
jgi:hypothetical protein